MAPQEHSDGGGRRANGHKQPAVPTPLGEEFKRHLAEVLSRVVTELLGRNYSPRIRLLDISNVSEAMGLGKSTIYTMVDEGRFPKPQRNLGKNLWRESTLIAWCDANDPNLRN
jgi:prophage regulatory protein